MKHLPFTAGQKRKASTQLALAWSQLESAGALLRVDQYREAVVHMYFACFYGSQALLMDRLGKVTHEHVERQLHKSFKERGLPPQTYVQVHSKLHNLRNEVDYRVTYVPDSDLVKREIKRVSRYLKWISGVVPRIDLTELIANLASDAEVEIEDVSYDVYPPSAYYEVGPRLTLWLPLKKLQELSPEAIRRAAERLLTAVGIFDGNEYAVGINSKLNQYEPVHMLMLDIDEPTGDVEHELSKIGGLLIKTRRGFHFIGRTLIAGQAKWEKELRRIRRHPKLKKMIDHDHIDMSLTRGYSTLRLTETTAKPFVPFFFKEL